MVKNWDEVPEDLPAQSHLDPYKWQDEKSPNYTEDELIETDEWLKSDLDN